MSLKYHFQHIKNKTLKNVVFFTFHGTQNETIIFKNQTITIKEQRLKNVHVFFHVYYEIHAQTPLFLATFSRNESAISRN